MTVKTNSSAPGALSFPEGLPTVDFIKSKRSVELRLYTILDTYTEQDPSMWPLLRVKCREFFDTSDTPIQKAWIHDGQIKTSIPLPRYAISTRELGRVSRELDDLVVRNFHSLVPQVARHPNEIVSYILTEAAQHVEIEMIREAFKIALLTRFATQGFHICGSETLGQNFVEEGTSPDYGRIPIPPLLDAQLDDLSIKKIKRLKKSVLSQLNRMILSQNKKNWFMIFLTTVVFLSNLELVYQNQQKQADAHYGTSVSDNATFALHQLTKSCRPRNRTR